MMNLHFPGGTEESHENCSVFLVSEVQTNVYICNSLK